MVTVSRRVAFAVALLAIVSASAFADKISDVKNTKHNLSTSGPGPVKATGESQICVFCHTPHKANTAAQAPLWNRTLSTTSTYTLYTSDSMDATLDQPDGSSKLCLSCHDGTMALGNVGVLNGQVDQTIALDGTTTDGKMPAGSGADTGFTRNLGTNLRNDHPISFTYDSTLATADAELFTPGSDLLDGNGDPIVYTGSHIGNRTTGAPRHPIPLENGKVQCVACHDPHIRDSDTARNAKFLRLNRFQESASVSQGSFNSTNDQVCLGCHSKAGWSGSAHANSAVAEQTYTTDAAKQREFDAGMPVWQAGCLNCHDTHTVQGARRLLREGTDSTATPKAGGAPALEETCYQCHDDGSGAVLSSYATVPNIKTDFGLTYRMPISSADQAAGEEMHAITDKDFVESTDSLGKTDLNNRHAECTDCHNPHRVIKNRLFNADPGTPDAAGTHTHTLAATEVHSNLASGVLSGTTGVEPKYDAATWGQSDINITFDLKKGPAGAGTAATSTHVTREYQVCLKCHSNYAWKDGSPPTTGPSIGTNGVTQYTNQAMEFHPSSPGETTGVHSSWHPVMAATGRSASLRAMSTTGTAQPFLAPWSDGTVARIGSQTMYCSDCHGSAVTSVTSVVPNNNTTNEDGDPWGPHGSNKAFILKGNWDQTSGSADADTLCFKCHNRADYADATAAPKLSGFRVATGTANAQCNTTTNKEVNLHVGHRATIGSMRCGWCHVAVPHGWQNKALLVDYMLDVVPGTTTKIKDTAATPCVANQAGGCTAGPYFLGAQLGGGGAVNWKTSGNWTAADCGGLAWMQGGGGGGGGPGGGGGGGCPY